MSMVKLCPGKIPSGASSTSQPLACGCNRQPPGGGGTGGPSSGGTTPLYSSETSKPVGLDASGDRLKLQFSNAACCPTPGVQLYWLRSVVGAKSVMATALQGEGLALKKWKSPPPDASIVNVNSNPTPVLLVE